MENDRLRECLAGDFPRLRDVVAGADLAAPVPSCPGWTVADLARHVGQVYLHKVACMAGGVEPDPWPPPGLAEEDPVALLDRAYAALAHEFDTRPADAPALTWYAPDQSVGFWIRRMAQETVIHRVDAELAAGVPQAPIPDDLAVDGIDEFLYVMLVYGTTAWHDWASEVLQGTDGGAVRLATTGHAWLVRPSPEGVEVAEDQAADAPAEVSGAPAAVQRWLWGRAGDEAVTITGDTGRVAQLRKVIKFLGQ